MLCREVPGLELGWGALEFQSPPWRSLTSGFNLPDTHVHHHWPCGDTRFHERGQVTAVHLLHVLQVRFTIIGDHLGTLLMNIQATICAKIETKIVWISSLLVRVF